MIAFAQSLRSWLPAFDNTHTHAMHTPYSSLRRPHTQRVQSCRVHNTRTHTRQTRTTTIQPHNVEEAPEQWLHRPTHTHTHTNREIIRMKKMLLLWKRPIFLLQLSSLTSHPAPRPNLMTRQANGSVYSRIIYVCVCGCGCVAGMCLCSLSTR